MVVANAAPQTITAAAFAPTAAGDPITWTPGATGGTSVTYTGVSAVAAQISWTATNLTGTLAAGGGGGGGGGAPVAPTYTLRARMAAVEIDQCDHSNTAFQEIFTTGPAAIARRPGGSMAFTYVGTPDNTTHTEPEPTVTDPWGFTHAFTIVIGTVDRWEVTAAYTGPDAETASHSETCF